MMARPGIETTFVPCIHLLLVVSGCASGHRTGAEARADLGPQTKEDVCGPDCEGRSCGRDGCRHSCGYCPGDGQGCVDGVCTCIPACDDQECGPDGCGGNCGTCPEDRSCYYGVCKVDAGDPCEASSDCPFGHHCTGSPKNSAICTVNCCREPCPEGQFCGEYLGWNDCIEGARYCYEATSPACGDGTCAGTEIPANCPWDCGGVPEGCTAGQGAGAVEQDVLGIPWVTIPGGCFVMGCAPHDATCAANEFPNHPVTLQGFRMMVTPATHSQVQTVLGITQEPCINCPAILRHFDAEAFCDAVGGRLPSEAEWEYVARGGGNTTWPCGDDPACLQDVSWFQENPPAADQPVGQLAPNAYGLLDIVGLVGAWVADCPYDYEDARDDGSAIKESCYHRIVRGGGAAGDAITLRSSARGWAVASDLYGIRCVRPDE